MSKTLFDLTYELARLLGVISEGVATGGTVTSLIDTVELTQDNDFWNGGTVWVLYDSAGAGAAPQGEYSVITDFDATTDTVSLRSTLTAAIASGDRYAIGRKKYPLHILTQFINQALREIPIVKNDITTVTIAADQKEYSLPSDVWLLKQVWLQTNTGDSNVNDWQEIFDYSVKKSATGTANVLVLDRQFDSGVVLMLKYLTDHQTLRAATDKLDDSIHINRVIYNAAVGALIWRKSKVGQVDENTNELLNYFQAKAQEINAQFAVTYPHRSARTIHLIMDRP